MISEAEYIAAAAEMKDFVPAAKRKQTGTEGFIL